MGLDFTFSEGVSLAVNTFSEGVFAVVEFRCVRGHVEVFVNGQFLFSADTVAEAHREWEEECAWK